MTVAERGLSHEFVPEEGSVTELEEDNWRELQLSGASLYRSAEHHYFDNVYSITCLTDDHMGYTEAQREGVLYALQIETALVLREMRGLVESYRLVIGGKNGDRRYGDIVPFDPKTMIVEDPDDLPILPGQEVIVFRSEIADSNGETLFDAVYTELPDYSNW